MIEKYDILLFSKNVPLQVQVQHIGNIPAHAHTYFELILFLNGICRFSINGQEYTMGDGDVAAVCPHEQHEFHSRDCVLVSVKFSQHLFEETLPVPIHPAFSCNSAVQETPAAFNELRRLIAEIVRNNDKQESGFELRNWAYTYELMDVLYNNFRREDDSKSGVMARRHAERMEKISNIIEDRYNQELTLSDIASELYLSVPYLSRFFENHFGTTFLSYLTDVRLNHAVFLLETTDLTIEDVSGKSGFPNSHSFVQSFKRKYDTLPSVYRRRQKAEAGKQEAASSAFEQHKYLAGLSRYLHPESTEKSPAGEQDVISTNAEFSVIGTSHILTDSWRKMIGISRASDLLLAKVQEMLKDLRKDVRFQFVRLNGILSDDLMVVNRWKNGSLRYDFTYVDLVLDFIRSINMKPFLSLTFMPRALAKYPDHYFAGSLTSEPKSISEWAESVSVLMKHLERRYGISEISSWPVTIWHEPDTPAEIYGFSSEDYFRSFYLETYRVLHSVCPGIRIGTPTNFFIPGKEDKIWLIEFLKWNLENDCLPDFLSFSYYDTALENREGGRSQKEFGFARPLILRTDANGLPAFLQHVRREIRSLGLKDFPIFIAEWNSSPSQQDLLNDTCYKSCYIVKNVLGNRDQVSALSYWSLTDLIKEAPMEPDMFHGGTGLYTANGIPKAARHAYTLLSLLGDEYLTSGEGWYATKKGDEIRIMLFNYQHFSKLYSRGERFDMTFTDRYTPFSPEKGMDIHLHISDLDNGTYQIRESSVNRKYGSSFDAWVKMGAREPEYPEELDILNAASFPQYTRYDLSVKNHMLELDEFLDSLEIRLLCIKQK